MYNKFLTHLVVYMGFFTYLCPMEKEFIPHSEALALKELGFDEPCFGYYVDGELRGINLGIEELGGVKPYYQRFGFHTLNNRDIDNPNKIVTTAPLFSQAFRWFREKYKLVPEIRNWSGSENQWYHMIFNQSGELLPWRWVEDKTYQETELACLKELIEIVKK